MTDLQTVKLPDIGDFESVEVIEVLIRVGDTVSAEDSLITVESDKASMEIPSPFSGVVTSVHVVEGQKVTQGVDILVMEVTDAMAEPSTANNTQPHKTSESKVHATSPSTALELPETELVADLVVIGAGPGGYTAAFRAADLGKDVVLIERYPDLGGVCLNVGCIPSKALLHTAQIITEVAEMEDHGISFGQPDINIDKLRTFKEKVIGQLTGGLENLAKQRKVRVIKGVAKFTSPNTLDIESDTGNKSLGFNQAIIAAGSQSIRIPGFPYEDPRLLDSTGALELQDIPPRLLIIGGGIIGLEMGCVYAALGSKITVVELSDGLMPGADRDLVRPLQKRLRKQFENIFLTSKVTAVELSGAGLKVTFEGGEAPETDTFDRVLLAVGRYPNSKNLAIEKAGVNVDERGFVAVDGQQRTNVEHIFAIGDIVGQPMLAHKATHEAKTAAEVVCGMKSWFDAKTIPSVAYTDPEIAWMGLTETDAKADNIAFEKGVFPWAASGRSLSIGRNEGLTKVLYDPESHQILGAGMVGPNAGELIAEAVLALEMGADIQDIALTVHPHPTLSETFNFACEVAEGTVTDIYIPPRKTKRPTAGQ